MFLPIGDTPNADTRPYVTYALIALNVLVFLTITLPFSAAHPDPNDPNLRAYLELVAGLVGPGVTPEALASQISAYDLTIFEYGFRPAEPSLIALFTSLFLHGGFLHLAGNMLFLWIYGDNVEHRLGRAVYLLAYLGTGVAATAVHALMDLDSPIPTVGASGAISGVLGFYFVFFPRNKVRVLVFLVPILVRALEVPARWVLGAYLVLDNLVPLATSSSGDDSGVAYGAHVGGFVAGVGAAWLLDQRERTAQPKAFREAVRELDTQETPRQTTHTEAFATFMDAGDLQRAAERYFHDRKMVGANASPRELLQLGAWLTREGYAKAALVVYRGLIERFPTGPVAAEAHAGAGEVQARLQGRGPSAYQHFVAALEADPEGPATDRARAARDAVRGQRASRFDQRR